jgi:hypothetical protein
MMALPLQLLAKVRREKRNALGRWPSDATEKDAELASPHSMTSSEVGAERYQLLQAAVRKLLHGDCSATWTALGQKQSSRLECTPGGGQVRR